MVRGVANDCSEQTRFLLFQVKPISFFLYLLPPVGRHVLQLCDASQRGARGRLAGLPRMQPIATRCRSPISINQLVSSHAVFGKVYSPRVHADVSLRRLPKSDATRLQFGLLRPQWQDILSRLRLRKHAASKRRRRSQPIDRL